MSRHFRRPYPTHRRRAIRTQLITLDFLAIARAAGYLPGPDGKLSLPNTQDTAWALAAAAVRLLPDWKPGEPAIDCILTGPGPLWAYGIVQHALHGRVARLTLASPAATIVVWSHGLPETA